MCLLLTHIDGFSSDSTHVLSRSWVSICYLHWSTAPATWQWTVWALSSCCTITIIDSVRSGPTPGFGAIWAHIGRLAGCRIAGARRQWPQHRRTTEAGRWQERTLASKELIPAAPVAPPPVGVIGLLAQLLAAPLPLHTPLILFSTVCNTLGLLGRQMSDHATHS